MGIADTPELDAVGERTYYGKLRTSAADVR